MTARVWRRLWTADDEEEAATAAVEQLAVDGVPVPGALILTVVDEADDERWVSLPYGQVRALRDALTEWLDTQG